MRLWKRDGAQAVETAAPKGTRPSQGRPIDLVHLARQTLGDRGLECEVLGLMRRQLDGCTARLDAANDAERRILAHALKGAARNVGAFALAETAEALEGRPGDDAALAAMRGEIRRADAFIATLLR